MDAYVDIPVFEAVIVPHRSLSPDGLRRLLWAICLLCGINAAIFIHLGAWPVGGFTGIELLLAALLLRINALAARASEVVVLSSSGLRITRTDPSGLRSDRVLAASWLSMTLEGPPGRVPRLTLIARGQREEIGASLGEEEKRDLAAALTRGAASLAPSGVRQPATALRRQLIRRPSRFSRPPAYPAPAT